MPSGMTHTRDRVLPLLTIVGPPARTDVHSLRQTRAGNQPTFASGIIQKSAQITETVKRRLPSRAESDDCSRIGVSGLWPHHSVGKTPECPKSARRGICREPPLKKLVDATRSLQILLFCCGRWCPCILCELVHLSVTWAASIRRVLIQKPYDRNRGVHHAMVACVRFFLLLL